MFDAVCDNKALTIVLHQLWKCRYIYRYPDNYMNVNKETLAHILKVI